MTREKYERYTFSLDECKAVISVIPYGKKDPGYATAFLNVTLPDGRWISFKINEGSRLPIYKDKKEPTT